MWEAEGRSVDPGKLSPFEPEDVLYEFDEPRIFTVRDSDGALNLAYWSDTEGHLTRFVVVPTSTRILNELRRGALSVLDALEQPRCWACDVSHEGILERCVLVDFDAIPKDTIPAPGTMLWPQLEPLLTLKATGAEIVPGRVPGSAIRFCVEGMQRSFKILAEYTLGRQPRVGRPDEFMRRLFDLPTQRLRFSSLEISFRMPALEENLFTTLGEKSLEVAILEEVGRLLGKGVTWLTSSAAEEGLFSPGNPQESEAVLKALEQLTPTSPGAIDRIELRGQLVGSREAPLVLERTSRPKVKAAIRNQNLDPEVVDLVGRIRELDKDRLSFELRDIEGKPDAQRFVFDDELREDVFLAFQEDWRVRVVGTTQGSKSHAYALAISPRATTSLS